MNSKRTALDVAVNRPVNDWLKLESCSGESSKVPVINSGRKAYEDSLLHPLMKCRPLSELEVLERWFYYKHDHEDERTLWNTKEPVEEE